MHHGMILKTSSCQYFVEENDIANGMNSQSEKKNSQALIDLNM